MSVLAFKAISYGAEQIPDKFFEKIPGGFFTPAEKKKIKEGRDRRSRERAERHKSEERGSKRSSRRARSPQSEYTDDSEYDDTDDERAQTRRKKDRSRRAKSVGRSSSRSLSRGRHNRRNSGFDGDNRDMAHAGQEEPYRPYNPQDYAPAPAQGDYRPTSVSQPYGYPAQVNNFSRFRSATVPTVPTMAAFSTPVNSPKTCPPMLMRRPLSNQPFFFPTQSTPLNLLSRGTPVSASFSPSTEPPLAALFSRPLTNTPKPAAAQPYPAPPAAGQHDAYPPTFTNPNYAAGQRHSSVSAAKYTPGPGYAPSPMMAHASTVPPPAGTASAYPAYNPAEYSAKARDNAYASPPPFNRQRSNSQPSYAPYTTYIPPSEDQRLTAYDANNQPPPGRHSSTKPRREHRHRARSADTHSSSRRDHDDHRRSGSRMTKVHGSAREGAGGYGGRCVGGRTSGQAVGS
jgi:hypothetical protein